MYNIVNKENFSHFNPKLTDEQIQRLRDDYHYWREDLLLQGVPIADIETETGDIMMMFRAIYDSVKKLKDNIDDLNLDRLTFYGFDANNDLHFHCLHYDVYYKKHWYHQGWFHLNSHNKASLNNYRRMYKYWKGIPSPQSVRMTKKQLIDLGNLAW